METRANYIAVGFFTLTAIVVVFAVIYWFGRYGEDDNLVPIDIRIQGSVSGLGPASTVQFNGIDVGRVDGLSLDTADPRYVIVHALISNATPVFNLNGVGGTAQLTTDDRFMDLASGGIPPETAYVVGLDDDGNIATAVLHGKEQGQDPGQNLPIKTYWYEQ